MGYVYIASPYSHRNKIVEETRFEEALRYFHYLTERKILAYSPIVQCHHLTIKYGVPGDHVFWKRFDAEFIMKAEQVHFLLLEDWQGSKGIAYEREFCVAISKPHSYIKWDLYTKQYIDTVP